MKQLTKAELQGLLTFNQSKIGLYVYSPFCGTCKLARQMLDIALEAVPNVTMYQLNINHDPQFAQQWKVRSVPCLIIFNKRDVEQKIYALQSVTFLHGVLKNMSKASE